MGILIDKNSKVLVQGMTGSAGSTAAQEMMEYGTNIVCGVTPKKGGQEVLGKPIYNSVKEAVENHPELNTSCVYAPALFAKSACIEALEAGIKLVLCIAENVPIHDAAEIIEVAKKHNARFLGPSSLGALTADTAKIGSIGGASNYSYTKGDIGLVSKSGGMCSETALMLKQNDFGVSTAVAIGGDTISGTNFCDILEMFEKDDETKAVVMYGEVGGEYENMIGDLLKEKKFTKPLIAYISGKFAESLPQVTLGHAGAIVEGENTTRSAKMKLLKDAGATVVEVHHEIIDELKKL